MRLRPTAASSPVVRYQQNCTVQHNKGLAPLSPNNSKHQPAREKVPAVPIRRDLQSHCHFPGDNYYSGRPAMYPEIRGAKARAKTRPTCLSVKRETLVVHKKTPLRRRIVSHGKKRFQGERPEPKCARQPYDWTLLTPAASVPTRRPGALPQCNGEKRERKKNPL